MALLVPNEKEIELAKKINALEVVVAKTLSDYIEQVGDSVDMRAMSIARTHIETGFLWAMQGLLNRSGRQE